MASLPGGEMETLMTSNPGGLRKRAQIGSEKNLKQVVYNAAKITNLCGLMMYVEAVINVDHITVYELYLILDINSFKYVQS